MAEYIEREELIARLKRNLDACNTGTIETLCFRGAIMIAQSLPAADVAPVVHGRWVPFHSTAAGDIQYCSACKIGNAAKSDFCPHCGAKMDGGVE